MKMGSLFTGAGGMDLGFERAGFTPAWQVENSKWCTHILETHWPHVERYEDVTTLEAAVLEPVDTIIGGDPCPSRSAIRHSGGGSVHPDLSGYFLSIVGRARPRWVVRENVYASDDVDFALGLELLGYRVVAIGLDSRDFTSQSRGRQFLVGSLDERVSGLADLLERDCLPWDVASSKDKGQVVAPCLTAHLSRNSKDDCYIYDARRRDIRTLDCRETEALQGFPTDWTAGVPRTARWRMIGNAVTVPVAHRVATWIKELDQGR